MPEHSLPVGHPELFERLKQRFPIHSLLERCPGRGPDQVRTRLLLGRGFLDDLAHPLAELLDGDGLLALALAEVHDLLGFPAKTQARLLPVREQAVGGDLLLLRTGVLGGGLGLDRAAHTTFAHRLLDDLPAFREVPAKVLGDTANPESGLPRFDPQAEPAGEPGGQIRLEHGPQGHLPSKEIGGVKRAEAPVLPAAEIDQHGVNVRLGVLGTGSALEERGPHQVRPFLDLSPRPAARDAANLLGLRQHRLNRLLHLLFDQAACRRRRQRPKHGHFLRDAEGHVPTGVALGLARVLDQRPLTIGREAVQHVAELCALHRASLQAEPRRQPARPAALFVDAVEVVVLLAFVHVVGDGGAGAFHRVRDREHSQWRLRLASTQLCACFSLTSPAEASSASTLRVRSWRRPCIP